MPRDSNGVYSLPSGSTAVTGETAEASTHNTPLADIATALTGSLPRNGSAAMAAALSMNDFKISNLADGTDPDDAVTVGQVAGTIAGSVADAPTKTTPVDADSLSLVDSAALNALKRVTWANLKATLKTYFDTLYAAVVHSHTITDAAAFVIDRPENGDYRVGVNLPWIVSNTQDAVDNAGNNETSDEKKLKSAIEVRKDVELSIVSNTASVSGATRVSGGLPSWLTTNVSRGSGGSNGGFNSGTKLTVAETTGTQRAFTKTLLDTVMGSAYTSGGDPDRLFVSPYVKSVFVTFMSDTNVAAFRYSVDSGGRNTIVGTADMYEGPFGKMTIVPNRVMANSAATARRAFLLDKEKVAWGWLRSLREDPNLAKTGDAKKGMIIGEGTLVMKNEAANGVIADLFGLTGAS